VGLIFTLGFSLVYQPREYEVSHGNLQQQLLIFASGQADSEDLGYLIDLQQYLEEHNVEWIVVNTLTGYGNILTLILVGTSLVFWRAYFKDIPLSAVLALLLPQKVKELLDKIADSIKLDLELEDD
jgi:hypothetical protein